jgi:glutamine cyclotransferase
MPVSFTISGNIDRFIRKVNGFSGAGLPLLLSMLIWFTPACREQSPLSPPFPAPGDTTVTIVRPLVVNTFPHDGNAFTQGLLYHEGFFYESTGRYGQSSFRKVDVTAGEVIFRHDLSSQFFGEGLALLNHRFVQLTWQAGLAFVYDAGSLAVIDTLSYEGEGWGLASNGTSFIMSDGSDRLTFRNAQFQVTGTLTVKLPGETVTRLNELEYVNDYIYANIWLQNRIFEISPANGRVVRIIDCDSLVALEQPRNGENVLNGIAYRPESDTFFLTGKNWRRVFEVRIPGVEKR